MRFAIPACLILAVAPFAPAADPKPDPTKAGYEYGVALQKTAALLAKVKDEATAAEAKPQLDKLHEESREARVKLFKALAEVDVPDHELAGSMVVFWKNAGQCGDTITAEFERIGGNHKAAYKVLRETKVFAALEKEYEGKATMGANDLMNYAKAYSVRNDSKVPKLEDLAAFSETGKKALTDPWGFPYHLVVAAGKDGRSRLHIWTVSPYTGKKLGTPPPDEKEK